MCSDYVLRHSFRSPVLLCVHKNMLVCRIPAYKSHPYGDLSLFTCNANIWAVQIRADRLAAEICRILTSDMPALDQNKEEIYPGNISTLKMTLIPNSSLIDVYEQLIKVDVLPETMLRPH